MAVDHGIIEDYATRLRQCSDEDHIIREFRERYDHRFRELCMVHLSILIDIPWNWLEHPQGHTPKSVLRRLLAGQKVNPQSSRSNMIPAFIEENIIELIGRLNTVEACSTEGIFRKVGNASRKRQLQEFLLHPDSDTTIFNWENYSVHDLASTLKSIIKNLRTPLLTDRLLPLFHRVAGLRLAWDENKPLSTLLDNANCMPAMNSSMNDFLIESKQLKALRLLFQLIPAQNVKILKCLLELLTKVVHLEVKNRMTCSALGTVFGPVLFPLATPETNSKVVNSTLRELQIRYHQISHMCAVLIEAGPSVFRLPRTLAEDVHVNSTHLPPYFPLGITAYCTPPTKSIQPGSLQGIAEDSPSDSIHSGNYHPAESPPLVTGIRFATPKLTYSSHSDLNLTTTEGSPVRNGHCNSTSSLESPEHNVLPRVPLNYLDDLLLHRSRKADCKTPPVPSSPQLRNDPSTVLQRNVVGRESLSHRRRSASFLQIHTQPNTVDRKDEHKSFEKIHNFRGDQYPKRRRYTEMKLLNRTHSKEQKKNIFSPCPPLKMFHIKRVVNAKPEIQKSELGSTFLQTSVI